MFLGLTSSGKHTTPTHYLEREWWDPSGGSLYSSSCLHTIFLPLVRLSQKMQLSLSDCWWDEPLKTKFPELSSYANNNTLALHQILGSQNLVEHFHTPMSQQAFQQFNLLQHHLQDRVGTNLNDVWLVKGTTRGYSSIKMYKHMKAPSTAHSLFRNMWKTSYRLRHKIFFWLLLHDRVNTRNLLNRKTMHLDDCNGAICTDNTEETLVHLFWNFPFALQYWDQIIPLRKRGISVFDDIQLALDQLPHDIALDIVMMGCWGIWSIRNDKIFKSAASHIPGWLHYLQEGLWAVQIKAKPTKAEKIRIWVEQNL